MQKINFKQIFTNLLDYIFFFRKDLQVFGIEIVEWSLCAVTIEDAVNNETRTFRSIQAFDEYAMEYLEF